MLQLIASLLGSLGRTRAIDNARTLLDDRRAEAAAVRRLTRRLASSAPAAAAVAPAAARPLGERASA